jgi:hypothetical protein
MVAKAARKLGDYITIEIYFYMKTRRIRFRLGAFDEMGKSTKGTTAQ